MSVFEDLPALSPVQFFGLTANCYQSAHLLKPNKTFLLPSTADLLCEKSFADVYASWNVDKISFLICVDVPFQNVDIDNFRKGDSIELFIDTRDLKTKGVVSRYCHHFLFFPSVVQNFLGREVTRFRGEDTHRLCHPEDLQVSVDVHKNSYALAIEIPASCLHGYDPLSFPRLGFTYQINRTDGAPQHFSVSSEEYAIEQHPAMWGTLKFV